MDSKVNNMKNTKILATISDKNCSVEFIQKLFNKGMNGIRINTAHQDIEGAIKVITNVRKVSDRISILIDTKGPEIRTIIKDEPINVKKKDIITIKPFVKDCDENSFSTTYSKLYTNVKKNNLIMIDDGHLELKVKDIINQNIICEVMNEGEIKGKKTMNFPEVETKLPALTKKDIEFIHFSIKHDIDFIAHSFVRNKHDIIEIQKILDKHKSKIKIIAKIENHEGVENIDEILENVYGIMIARGDLAVEIPAEKIPIIQKDLIKKCMEQKKIVITATQMLHSMIENPRPTRAEISDVANAICDGTDTVMLSGETAQGKHPEEAVEIMTKVAKEVEKNKISIKGLHVIKIKDEIAAFLASSAIDATNKLPIKAIICDTLTGRTARYLSSFRGLIPIFVECYDKRVMRELSLSYGIRAEYMEQIEIMPGKFIQKALKPLLKNKLVHKNDLVLILAGSFGATHGASFIEISKVKEMIIE